MSLLPNSLRLLVDDHEQNPIITPGEKFSFPWQDHRGNIKEFPVEAVKQRMPEGDYGFEGYERYSLGEKKGSIGEARQNLFARRTERTRFFKSIQRLCKSTRHPILILTFPPDDKFKLTFDQTEDQVWCRLFTWVHRHNLTLLWWDKDKSVSYRRTMGIRLCQLMWTFAWEEIMKGEANEHTATGISQSGRRYAVPAVS